MIGARYIKRVEILGVAASVLLLVGVGASSQTARADVSDYGIDSVGASLSTLQAGAHPDFTTTINLKRDPATETTYASTKDVAVDPPLGLVGNPTGVPTCSVARFIASNTWFEGNPFCPQDSQVGIVKVDLRPGFFTVLNEPLYNLPGGNGRVARLGFVGVAPIILDIEVRSDYGLTVTAHGAAEFIPIREIETTLWGVPADPSHDSQRMTPQEAVFGCTTACLAEGEARSSGIAPVPFMTNPTHCGPQQVDFALTSYQLPGQVFTDTASLPDTTGCASVPFDPSMSLQPTTQQADASSGLDVDLQIPQGGLFFSNTLGSAHLRNAVVTLPQGMSLNPSSADGLQGCTEAQIGLIPETDPPRFNSEEAICPDSSKVGTVRITTPLLEDPLEGSFYVARQGENPFGSLLAGYIVAKGEGVIIKQAVRFALDPQTGQVTATVENAPQQPFSSLEMHFKGGARGVLRTPDSCGTYSSTYELTPWSGNPPAIGTSSFEINEGCDTGGFAPRLSAGVTNPVAGSFSPVVTTLMQESGEANLSGLEVGMPPGVLAKIAGVPLCPDAQASTGECPVDSQVGSTAVAVGAGSLPLWIPQPGKSPTAVYLAGPYEGGPYSLVVKTPAQAGPFDLGNVIVRAPIEVDPESTKVTVKSDPLPQILEGVPITYRTVHVKVDRPEFTLNPTSCEPMAVTGTATSIDGQTASLSDRFQVGSCERLRFKPKLSMRLTGPTHRGAFPSFHAVLKMPKGGANIARASVRLPRSEFVENAHFRNICTRVQFAAEGCPAKSVYGHVVATTPLLEQPLSGPVYLRSSNNQLPDLVADLRGQIHVVLDGRIDSVNGGLRAVFQSVPDAPVSQFKIDMQGRSKGLLVNSENLCKGTHRSVVKFTAQNGRVWNARIPLKANCGK